MEHSPTFAYRFETEAEFTALEAPRGIEVDVIGQLPDADGWHVNTSAVVDAWAEWHIFPSKLKRVFL